MLKLEITADSPAGLRTVLVATLNALNGRAGNLPPTENDAPLPPDTGLTIGGSGFASGAAGGSGNTAAPEVAESRVLPAAQKLADENGVDTSKVTGTGKDGRVTKGDVDAYIKANAAPDLAAPPAPAPLPPAAPPAPAPLPPAAPPAPAIVDDDPLGLGPTAPPMTLDDAKASLMKVNEKHGLEVARDLLSRFGATRISDLPSDRFGDFVAQAAGTLESGVA